MTRIKIVDLPSEGVISMEEMKRIRGGQVNMFLKIDDVKGESRDDKHKDEIDVLAWSWGMTQGGTTQG